MIKKTMYDESFNRLKLNKRKLKERNWDRCRFKDCNFEGSDLTFSIIQDCEFINCNFYSCDISHACLEGSVFKNCNIKMVNLLMTDLSNTDFSTSNIDYSTFPLWCGSFNVILDDKQKQQLLYHLLRIAPEYRSKKLCAIANGFEHSNREI